MSLDNYFLKGRVMDFGPKTGLIIWYKFTPNLVNENTPGRYVLACKSS
jgi:hypothetical protein